MRYFLVLFSTILIIGFQNCGYKFQTDLDAFSSNNNQNNGPQESVFVSFASTSPVNLIFPAPVNSNLNDKLEIEVSLAFTFQLVNHNLIPIDQILIRPQVVLGPLLPGITTPLSSNSFIQACDPITGISEEEAQVFDGEGYHVFSTKCRLEVTSNDFSNMSFGHITNFFWTAFDSEGREMGSGNFIAESINVSASFDPTTLVLDPPTMTSAAHDAAVLGQINLFGFFPMYLDSNPANAFVITANRNDCVVLSSTIVSSTQINITVDNNSTIVQNCSFRVQRVQDMALSAFSNGLNINP